MEITVAPADTPTQGWLRCGGRKFRCALGRAGVRRTKREGDGATPAGRFPLRRVLYRADRLEQPPATKLPLEALNPADGWCDDPNDPSYNRQIRVPHAGRHERLWRDDGLYDLIVVLGHNDDPPRPGHGSAIFLHVARPDYGPTEGCIAVALEDLRAMLVDCGTGDHITVSPANGPGARQK